MFRGEYFLADYIYKYGNFNTSTITSAFNPEGFIDCYNSDKTQLSAGSNAKIVQRRKYTASTIGTNQRYEFIICPNIGFLASSDLLMKDCELRLNFDRSPPSTSLVECGAVTNACEYIEIKDCCAITEYVSSPSLRRYFETIDSKPLVYEYDDCEVILKSIELNNTDIRFDSIRGGNVPDYIFAAVVPQAAVNGDFETSSTYFHRHKVK